MKPLDGILVLDLSRILAGPLCGQRLADLGARVIKVESSGGDATRGFGPPFRRGESPYFMAYNRGKESIALDLKSEEGLTFVRAVLAQADVLVDNFRPGVMERLGLGDEVLRTLSPQLIHLSVRGYAVEGERATEPAFDLAVQAEAGLLAMTGDEDGAPCRMPNSAADLAAGRDAAEAVLGALFRRERGGGGARIEIALFDAAVAATGFHAQATLLGAPSPGRLGSRHPNLAPYQAFAAADDWFVLAVATDAQWERFLGVEGVPEDLRRERWARNEGRTEDRDDLAQRLAPVFRSQSRACWEERLKRADVPWGRVRGLNEALDEVEARRDDFRVLRDHARLGPVAVLGTAYRTDGAHWTASRPAPIHDEHGAALRAEFGTRAKPKKGSEG